MNKGNSLNISECVHFYRSVKGIYVRYHTTPPAIESLHSLLDY